MGLFGSNNAEKKLKELIGGFFLKSSFIELLKQCGLEANDGYQIQSEIKRKIKEENLSANKIEDELIYQIRKRSINNTTEKNNFNIEGEVTFVFGDNTKITIDFNEKNKQKSRNSRNSRNYKNSDSDRAKRNREAEKRNNDNQKGTGENRNNQIKYVPNVSRSKGDSDSDRAKRNREAERRNRNNQNFQISTTFNDNYSKSYHNPTIDKKLNEKRWLKYILNQENIRILCPDCNSKIVKTHKYCYNCGLLINEETNHKKRKKEKINKTQNTDKNKLKDENKPQIEEINTKPNENNNNKDNNELLKELEQIYNEKISSNYSTKFKFAYTIFLDQLNRNPTKEFNKYYGMDYDTNMDALKKQANTDNYIKEGNPILSVKGAKVKEIRQILKENKLKVSGNKNELIKRIQENLTEDEIKNAFPKNSMEVTQEGLKFIDENKHALIYNKNVIKNTITPDKFNILIINNTQYKENPTDKTIYKILLEYYTDLETNKKIEDWYIYKDILQASSFIYHNLENTDKQLEYDFKLFISYINNYATEPINTLSPNEIINLNFTKKLIKLLNTLNYDINKLKNIFHNAYINIQTPKLKISEEETLIYLLKLFNGETPEELVEQLKNKY